MIWWNRRYRDAPLGFIGEERVNVPQLNLALEALVPTAGAGG